MSIRARWHGSVAQALGAALLASCGDNSSSWTPLVQSIEPQVVRTGATDIAVYGKRFAPGATAYWNGNAQPTTFSSDSVLHVELHGKVTSISGLATLAVANEGSYRSREITVTVIDAPLQINSLNPGAVAVGAQDFMLTVSGTGFVPGSQVSWNGTPLQTQFSSSTTLQAQVPTALVAVSGSGVVTVMNPAPCSQFASRCPDLSNPFACMVGLGSQLRTIAQPVTDLTVDAVRELLYLSIPSYAPTSPNTIAVVDPVQGKIVASVSAINPYLLSASGDGQYLYAGLGSAFSGPSTLARYELPGLTGAVSWSQGSGISDIEVAPGAPHTIAVSIGGFRVGILDDGVPRPVSATLLVGPLQWGADASRLFAMSGTSAVGFYILSVDANGAILQTQLSPLEFFPRGRIHYDPVMRRVYADSGQSVDEQGSSTSTFEGSPLSGCVMTPDGARGKAFFACSEQIGSSTALTIHSFDITTGAKIATVLLNSWAPFSSSAPESPWRIVRWGNSGLAVAGLGFPGGSVYLYSGPFVN